MIEVLRLLPEYLNGHLFLTLVALTAGIAISVPAGIIASRITHLERLVLGIASVIQTIPGLALLAAMVPALAALGFQSIGYLPALIGLVLYSVLPILQNTVSGLAAIDPSLREAARGVGMTPAQQLWRVELPLARPVIMAGVRISTVTTVGMATLSTPVGAPSLGNFIFSGLQTRNLTFVLAGCVAAAGLALLLDGLVRTLASGLELRRKGRVWAAALAVLVMCGYTTFAMSRSWFDRGPGPILIGAKPFTEQYILGELLAAHIQRTTGRTAEVRSSLGSTVIYDALRSGDVGAYVDYSGTLWATVLKRTGQIGDRSAVLSEVTNFLRDREGIRIVASLGFENAYCLAMRRTDAEREGVKRISDLTARAGRLTIGGDYEFFSRSEWQSLRVTYGLAFASERSMDPSLMYAAIDAGQVNVISAYSTDGRLEAFNLIVLDDDRGAIPPYDAVVLVSARLANEAPEVAEALSRLDGRIDAATMRRLNHRVDSEGASPVSVAREFLDSVTFE